MPAPTLQTPRLRLRPWRAGDLAPFAALNADPRVMAHFPACLDRAASDAVAARIQAHFDTHGYGFWAVEVPGAAAFIGFVGLAVVNFEAAFTPAVEVAWRLAAAQWGRGYATEGARAALDFGFTRLGLDRIVAFTVPGNDRSQAVMRRLGMAPAGAFDHPRLPEGHALRRHLLFQRDREARKG